MRRSAIPCVPDAVGGFAGPLAGLHAGMTPRERALVVDRAVRFAVPAGRSRRAARAARSSATARSSRWRRRSTSRIRCSALVRRDVLPHLASFLEGGGRKIDAWYATLAIVEVTFDDEADAFRNINTAAELAAAAKSDAAETVVRPRS